MPDEQEQMSTEDREALGVGRAVLWVKKNWQFLALAGFIGGPNAVSMVMPKADPAPSQDVRLAVVETELKNLAGQVKDMNAKLDRALRRGQDDYTVRPDADPMAALGGGSVSRALRRIATPVPGSISVMP